MRKIINTLLSMALIFVSVSLYSQTYSWTSVEMREAYRKDTRSINGLPGPKYWQNHAKYKLNATLLANESALEGKGHITYFNNSPDTLKHLVIRLYQNFYKKGAARAWNIAPKDVTSGVKIQSIKVNGKKTQLLDKQYGYYLGTNRPLRLFTPLLPGDSVQIEIQWKFHIPEITRNRMGNYGKGRYFIAYWYPQIAVYDDISGWDNINFSGIVEFYNDFNDYDVAINVPADYAVWATGHLENGNEVYQQEILRRIEKANSSNRIRHIITQNDWKKGKVLKSKEGSRWHFIATNVTDFSFAAVLKYNWDASSVLVDSANRRRVRVEAIYPDSTLSFYKAARYAHESIEFLSYQWPGYTYPFEHMTSFSNGTSNGGMETPMMANDGDPKDTVSLAGLVFHEISHSYFPFFMGINEQKYAWMDEGWAAYLTGLFSEDSALRYHYFTRTASHFSSYSGKQTEMPLMYPSNFISNFSSYRVQAYIRSSLAYKFLRDALGDKLFKKALHAYIKRWNGKHPVPYDFFNTFANVTGQELSWFINPWFFQKDYADQSIIKVTNNNKIVVENTGGLPMPVKIKCTYDDGSTEFFFEHTSVWSTGNKAIVIQADKDKKINTIDLGAENIPDINRTNNHFEMQQTKATTKK